MTKDEVLATKIARLRKYVNEECSHGIPSHVLIALMEYEKELEDEAKAELSELLDEEDGDDTV